MVLPSGINKGTGLKAALTDFHFSRHNTLGVGDAENDHAFLRMCECSVAVSNALPALMNLLAQLAEGVDDEMWNYHLRNADYSRWLRESVKDREIADEVANIEKNLALRPSESRSQILDAIRKHYTAPA